MKNNLHLKTASKLARIAVIIAICGAFAPSCTRRPLDVISNKIRVVLTNNYSMPYVRTDNDPYNYGVLFYDTGTLTLERKDFCPEEGGYVNGPSGKYTVLTYSLDNRTTQFEGEGDIRTLKAYTEQETATTKATFMQCKHSLNNKMTSDGYRLMAVMGKAGYESDNIIKEPNAVFAGQSGMIDIPIRTTTDDDFVIPVENGYAFSQGRLTIRGITKTENIQSIQVFVTNLAQAKYIGTGRPEQVPASMVFFMDKINEDYIRGEFNYFGKLDDESIPNTAYIIITDTAGGKYLFVFDVTDQINQQEDNSDIRLNINYEIPDPKTGSTGFEPIIDDWDVVWYQVPIG